MANDNMAEIDYDIGSYDDVVMAVPFRQFYDFLTQLYNFINDTLVSEPAVLRHLILCCF